MASNTRYQATFKMQEQARRERKFEKTESDLSSAELSSAVPIPTSLFTSAQITRMQYQDTGSSAGALAYRENALQVILTSLKADAEAPTAPLLRSPLLLVSTAPGRAGGKPALMIPPRCRLRARPIAASTPAHVQPRTLIYHARAGRRVSLAAPSTPCKALPRPH